MPPATAEPSGALLLCALDQGTTSTRAIMYEAATLRPVAVHQLEHKQIMPQAGCVAPRTALRAWGRCAPG